MAKSRLEWAIFMAARGINVFIIVPETKRPLAGKSWFAAQTQQPEQIEKWFEEYPNCNYGLHLGNDYVVIDLDIKPHENGLNEFTAICAENGIDDFRTEFDTLMVETPGGGIHLYFKSPFPVGNANDFPKGIDIRGTIGYVVGPGSYYDGVVDRKPYKGTYEIINPEADIQPLPEFLVQYIHAPGERDPHADIPLVELDLEDSIEEATKWLYHRPPAIEGHNGNDHTYETVQFLRDFGLSKEGQLKVLVQSGWNKSCQPSWDLDELEGLIDNAWMYGRNRPGNRSPAYKVERLTRARPAGGYAAVLSEADVERMLSPPTLEVVIDNTTEVDPEIPQDVYDGDESLKDEIEEDEDGPWWETFEDFISGDKVREYVVADWLIAHGITHMIASRGTGKSTVALDLACHLALDMDWCEQPTAKGWCVLYLCGEDSEGMRLNGRAWVKQHDGLCPPSDRFQVCSKTISLNSNSDLLSHIDKIDQWANGRRVVVILDTWQRSTSGASKNDDVAMENAIKRAEWLARRLRGPMLSLVHPPKDGRLTVTGAGVQENTTSGLWNLTEETSGIKLFNARAKGSGYGKYILYKLVVTQLDGVDQFNRALNAVTVAKIGGSEDKEGGIEQQSRDLTAWADLISGIGEWTISDNPYDPIKFPTSAESIVKFLVSVYRDSQDEDAPGHYYAIDFVGDKMDFIPKERITMHTVRELVKAVFFPDDKFPGPSAVSKNNEYTVHCRKKPKIDGTPGTETQMVCERRDASLPTTL